LLAPRRSRPQPLSRETPAGAVEPDDMLCLTDDFGAEVRNGCQVGRHDIRSNPLPERQRPSQEVNTMQPISNDQLKANAATNKRRTRAYVADIQLCPASLRSTSHVTPAAIIFLHSLSSGARSSSASVMM
jgi:hypothetical protein